METIIVTKKNIEMKGITTYIFLFIFGFMVILSHGQAYSYPVRPGDEAWKAFENSNEMYSACQIPTASLKAMSTADLVITCLDYPLINTMYAHNDLQAGFDVLKRRFNGIKELLLRKDVGRELIQTYAKMDPKGIDSQWHDVEKGLFTLKFGYIETFLAQREVQGSLLKPDKIELIKYCLDAYRMKEELVDLYGSHGTSTTVWVMGRSLENEMVAVKKSIDYNLARHAFIEQGLVTNLEVVDDIVESAKNYVR